MTNKDEIRDDVLRLANDILVETIDEKEADKMIYRNRRTVYDPLVDAYLKLKKGESLRVVIPNHKNPASVQTAIRHRLVTSEFNCKLSRLGNVIIIKKL